MVRYASDQVAGALKPLGRAVADNGLEDGEPAEHGHHAEERGGHRPCLEGRLLRSWFADHVTVVGRERRSFSRWARSRSAPGARSAGPSATSSPTSTPRELRIGSVASPGATSAGRPSTARASATAAGATSPRRAVADLEGQPAPVGQPQGEHALGADLGHHAGLGPASAPCRSRRVGHELGVGAHGRRVSVAGPAAGPGPGRRRRTPAPDSGMAKVRIPQPSTASSTTWSSTPHASATQSRMGRLQRVPGAEVAVERPALEQAARQAERVLARAVVADPRGPRPVRRRGSRGSAGPQPSAASWRPHARRISPTPATCSSPPPWEAQASARCRSPSAKRSSTPARTLPQRLQRLGGRAGEHGQGGVGAGSRAVGLHGAPGDQVLALARTAPPRHDADQEPASGRRARIGSPSGSRPSRPT